MTDSIMCVSCTTSTKRITRVEKVSVIRSTLKRKNSTLSSPESLLIDCFDRFALSEWCVCTQVCLPTWTLWTVSILRVMAAGFRRACFHLISLTSRQAIWDTEMCYLRATLMACSDACLHAHCISETLPHSLRLQSYNH